MNTNVILAAILCWFSVQGSPLRQKTCRERLSEVRQQIFESGDITSDPHWIPECDSTGLKWRPAQCDHHDSGFCFCVDVNTGEAREDTKSHYHSKETLNCVPAEIPAPGEKFCQFRQSQYRAIIAAFQLQGGTPFDYYPECEEDGKFLALQRDSVSFFCVDTNSGDKIPRTEVGTRFQRPMTEVICQAFSREWQAYLDYLKTAAKISEDHDEHEEVTSQSCSEGFEYIECGCARICEPGKDMETSDAQQDCQACQPVCSCPVGLYEFNGTCISNVECMYSSVLEENHELIDIRGAIWEEYQLDHPNEEILAFQRIGNGEFNEFGFPVEQDGNHEGMVVEQPIEEPVKSYHQYEDNHQYENNHQYGQHGPENTHQYVINQSEESNQYVDGPDIHQYVETSGPEIHQYEDNQYEETVYENYDAYEVTTGSNLIENHYETTGSSVDQQATTSDHYEYQFENMSYEDLLNQNYDYSDETTTLSPLEQEYYNREEENFTERSTYVPTETFPDYYTAASYIPSDEFYSELYYNYDADENAATESAFFDELKALYEDYTASYEEQVYKEQQLEETEFSEKETEFSEKETEFSESTEKETGLTEKERSKIVQEQLFSLFSRGPTTSPPEVSPPIEDSYLSSSVQEGTDQLIPIFPFNPEAVFPTDTFTEETAKREEGGQIVAEFINPSFILRKSSTEE